MVRASMLFQGASQPLYRPFEIALVMKDGTRRQVIEDAVLRAPFYTLRRFRTEPDAPPILIVPPLSGHFPILMRDVVVGLLDAFEVVVLDWANVRHVPMSRGAFGFDDNIRAIEDALLHMGPGVAVVALCQGGVPTLAAVADLAARAPGAAPAALALVAAPVDPLANPTAVVRLIRSHAQAWYDVVPLDRVSADHDGAGRWVYPAEVQLAGLEIYREHRATPESEIGRKLAGDDGTDPLQFPFEDLYTSVMDLDARLFTETIGRVFLSRDLARGGLHFEGRRIAPEHIAATALMTIEGELDDIAAPGQTAAAHALCPALPQAEHTSLVVEGAGHFSLFHGRIWRNRVLPVLRDFIAPRIAVSRRLRA